RGEGRSRRDPPRWAAHPRGPRARDPGLAPARRRRPHAPRPMLVLVPLHGRTPPRAVPTPASLARRGQHPSRRPGPFDARGLVRRALELSGPGHEPAATDPVVALRVAPADAGPDAASPSPPPDGS